MANNDDSLTDNSGMSFEKLKAYLSNPSTIGPAINDSLDSTEKYSAAKKLNTIGKVINPSYDASPQDIAQQVDKDRMMQNVALGSIGGINMKPNLGSMGGQVIESTNPTNFTKNLREMFRGKREAMNANDIEAARHFDDTINNMMQNQQTGKVHTPVSEDTVSKIMSYISGK